MSKEDKVDKKDVEKEFKILDVSIHMEKGTTWEGKERMEGLVGWQNFHQRNGT
jgi:hypothetical protein